jgi:hypothetical protein
MAGGIGKNSWQSGLDARETGLLPVLPWLLLKGLRAVACDNHSSLQVRFQVAAAAKNAVKTLVRRGVTAARRRRGPAESNGRKGVC